MLQTPVSSIIPTRKGMSALDVIATDYGLPGLYLDDSLVAIREISYDDVIERVQSLSI